MGTWFYYLRARYLNPGSGRYWTVDPYEGVNLDPLSLHRYVYARENPANTVDPSGNEGVGVVEAVSVATAYAQLAVAFSVLVLANILVRVKTETEKQREERCKTGGGIPLYRTMKADWAGFYPLVEQSRSRRGLGVKIDPSDSDVFTNEDGNVQPYGGGMSVAPDLFTNLPDFKLSQRFGGNAKNPDPLWCINSAFIYATGGLFFRPDIWVGATHGTVEPIYTMRLKTYQEYLASTQLYWIKITDQK